jgi:hypothetical protein
MKIIKFIVCFIFFILFAASLGYAQQPFQASAYFSLGFPQNEFRNNVDQIGYSGIGHFAYNFRNSPFLVGISLGILVYGSETRAEPFNSTVPDVMVDVTTTNNIFLCHFLFRIQPSKGKLRPYLDGLIGFNYLFTDTRVHSQKFAEGDPIASSNIYNDITFSYGAGGGLMVQVFSKKRNKRKGSFAMYVDMAVRYLKGGRAGYLKEGSIRLENDQVLYDVSRSTTDLVTGYIGVSFSF